VLITCRVLVWFRALLPSERLRPKARSEQGKKKQRGRYDTHERNGNANSGTMKAEKQMAE
jgi:hypothetical protein